MGAKPSIALRHSAFLIPNSALFIEFLPVLILALAPRCVMVGIADDGGDDSGAFGIDHLLQFLAHLTP